MTNAVREQNVRRTGALLVAILLGVIVYSLAVIRTRGRLPEPANLTPLQRLFRGL